MTRLEVDGGRAMDWPDVSRRLSHHHPSRTAWPTPGSIVHQIDHEIWLRRAISCRLGHGLCAKRTCAPFEDYFVISGVRSALVMTWAGGRTDQPRRRPWSSAVRPTDPARATQVHVDEENAPSTEVLHP